MANQDNEFNFYNSENDASMLITGSSMGIVEAIQKYRQYEDADPKIRDLMDKLRKFEEHNMEKLKDFL